MKKQKITKEVSIVVTALVADLGEMGAIAAPYLATLRVVVGL